MVKKSGGMLLNLAHTVVCIDKKEDQSHWRIKQHQDTVVKRVGECC